MDHEFATGLVFLGYIGAVFLLAILANRLLQRKEFLAEYFLGSRGLGIWALAFSFAATSASGGSFTGFPSLIYTYGWVLAFWIASYMIVPPVTMGLLGKRINQLARRAGAITIPDILRERFQSPGLGLFASLTIVFFTLTNLVAQFKAGGLILNVLLEGTPGYSDRVVPWVDGLLPDGGSSQTGYLIGLVLFAVTVIVYTAYGGFRAVVWTDVMQGVVMGLGVLLLIPFTLWAVGGLDSATRRLNDRPGRAVIGLRAERNAIEYRVLDAADVGLMVEHGGLEPGVAGPTVDVSDQPGGLTLIRVGLETEAIVVKGQETGRLRVLTTTREVAEAVQADPKASALIEVEVPLLARRPDDPAANDGSGAALLTDGPLYLKPGSDLVFGPGRTRPGVPFHPLAAGISFFFMWSISGAGQPGTMVRLMAFKDSRTLRYSIFTVSVYFGLIYLPMVLIFVSAQHLIHPAELTGGTDQIMPELAKRVAPWWLAGILIAAPFAAVMSTVDSFLLLISSAIVRDVYQRFINPDVSERTVKRASYATTALAGLLVMFMAFNPPRYLQDFIVLTGGGFAATFLAPIFLGLYWKRMTRDGAWLAMTGGFAATLYLFHPLLLGPFGYVFSYDRIRILGFDPIVVGLFVSFALGIIGSLASPRPPEHLVRKFFARPEQAGEIVAP
ncbi:hypothetical protein BH23PLA1_BH23PLA1_06820 [soil metagenome]